MRTIFWILMLLVVGLVGYLLHGFVNARRSQVEAYRHDVGPEEIARYQAQADSLKGEAAWLRQRLETKGLLRRQAARAHLALLEDEVVALERAIENWRKSKATRADVDLHRQVILLYGEASAAARALAADTLPDDGPAPR